MKKCLSKEICMYVCGVIKSKKNNQMENQVMTIEQVMQLDITQVDKVYQGVDNNCRCGCAGEYYYATEDAQKVEKLLKKAKKYIKEGVNYEIYDFGVNVPTHDKSAKGKCVTIYFNK